MLIKDENSRLAALTDPWSAYVESIRALRTSILLSRGGSPPQVILVTSSVAAEGKSMLSVNLATLLAQQGKQVLLIDGDLRRPTLHRTLHIPNDEGLSSFLAGTSNIDDPADVGVTTQELPSLTILTAGPVPPYPAELLGSEQMRQAIAAWRLHFDFILIDAAPVLPVTDSVVLEHNGRFHPPNSPPRDDRAPISRSQLSHAPNANRAQQNRHRPQRGTARFQHILPILRL